MSLPPLEPVVIFDMDETIIHTVLLQDMTASARKAALATADPMHTLLTLPLPSLPTTTTTTLLVPNVPTGHRPHSPSPGRGYTTEYRLDRCTGRAELSDDGELVIGEFYVSHVRPGMLRALRRLCTRCTLCLCTFGERRYVADIVAALDPDGSIFGDRVLDRASFTFGTKVVPAEWGGAAAAVAFDDQPIVWEEQTLVARVEPFCACSAAPPHGTVERDAAEAYAAGLTDALEACLASWRRAPPKTVDKGFAAHVAAHWPLDASVQLEPVAPPPPLPHRDDDLTWWTSAEDENSRLTTLLFCCDVLSPIDGSDDSDSDDSMPDDDTYHLYEPMITFECRRAGRHRPRHRLPSLVSTTCADA